MIYGYENLNYDFSQISEMIKSGKYTDFKKLDRIFTLKKYKRKGDGRIIPPSREDDEKVIMYNLLMAGDIIITSSLINFSASTDGIIKNLKMYLHKGARIISVIEHFDSNCLDRRTFEIIAVISEEAQRLRRASQKKGIDSARAAGRYGKQMTVEDFPLFGKLYIEYEHHNITKAEMAKRLQISRPTLDKLFKQHNFKQLNAYQEMFSGLLEKRDGGTQ